MPRQIIVDTRHGRATGHGDVVLHCWLCEGSKGADPELRLFAVDEKQGLMRLFGQEPYPHAEGAIWACEAFNRDVRDGKEKPRIETWTEALGLTTQPKRPPTIIPDECREWARTHDYFGQRIANGNPLVLLFPQTTDNTRRWGYEKWAEVARRLEARGAATCVMTSGEEDSLKSTPHQFGHHWPYVAAAMDLASVCVGNDSAAVHISGTIGKPTIALLGPTSKLAFAHMPDVEVVTSDLWCTGCNWHGPPLRPECQHHGCDSLRELSIERVVDRVIERIDRECLPSPIHYPAPSFPTYMRIVKSNNRGPANGSLSRISPR